jgi:3-oxoacyl-[acyl-carrier protein] reductase
MGTLSGQIAIVTGAATGLGRNYALALAKAGCHVSLADVRSEVAAVALECRKLGVAGSAYLADVSLDHEVRRVVDGTLRDFGRIDILINNAGVAAKSLPTDSLHKSLADYGKVIGTNLKGEFMFGRAVLPLMLAQKSGHIINIACDHVHTPPGRPTGAEGGTMDLYDAAYWGVLALTLTWAKVGKEHNVRVNSFCIGGVRSGMLRDFFGAPRNPPSGIQPAAVCDLAIELIAEGPGGRTGENIGVWPGFELELQPIRKTQERSSWPF